MLIWRATKRVVTFRPLQVLNSEMLWQNIFPKPMLYRGNCGWHINMTRKLCYVPAKPSAYSTLKKLQETAKQSKLGRKPGKIKSWLEMHDAYTLHKSLSRKFPRNPYNVNNVLDVWECDW
jgi:hypothetical protein